MNIEIVFEIASFQIHIDNIGELVKLRLTVPHQNFAPWHLEKVKITKCIARCVYRNTEFTQFYDE